MKKKILVVIASYYKNISKGLLKNAKEAIPLSQRNNVYLLFVPGVFEIPVTIAKNINKYDGFVALGCVIKGETPHFDFISKTTFDAIMKLSVDHKKPIGNGIITALDKQQAYRRSSKEDLDKGILKSAIDGKLVKSNKGREATRAVLSVLGILKNESK